MLVYSEYYDELGVLSADGRLVQFSDQTGIFKAYLPSRWVIIGEL